MSTPYEKESAMLAAMRAATKENQRLHAELGKARAEASRLLKERDAYAEAMAIALREGLFVNKRAAEKQIRQLLKDCEALTKGCGGKDE